ncbi:MAG: hypothetical protein ABNH26_07360 [Celeribacter sp.]|jgi:hypothetical protein
MTKALPNAALLALFFGLAACDGPGLGEPGGGSAMGRTAEYAPVLADDGEPLP